MPSSGAGGMRRLEDEKQLLTELGRLFHTVKASYKERQNARKAAARKHARDPAAPAAAHKARRRRQRRRSRAGGSVWITLKGGFATVAVPAVQQTRRVERKCFRRGDVAVARRVAALENAEAYIESAWSAAEQAGIAERDATAASGGKTLCDEGVVYMREQFAVAVQMLEEAKTRAPGVHLRRVVEEAVSGGAKGSGGGNSSSSSGPSAIAAAAVCVAPASSEEVDAHRHKAAAAAGDAAAAADWEDIAARELAIRQNPLCTDWRSGNADVAAAVAEERFKATVSDAGRSLYYRLAEPASPSSPADIAATKCIIRIRNSQKQKHTAILSSQKSVNYFKSNFMQVLRKELNSSKLPRGAVEETGAAEGHQPVKSQQHQQQHQQHGGGGKGKRRGKR